MARTAHQVVPVMAQDGSPRKGRKAASAARASAETGAPALVGAAAVKAHAEAAFSAAAS